MGDFPEADWRILRDLAPVALERFCRRVLEQAARLVRDSADAPGPCHDRYLELFRLIHERDEELAAAFNDLRRSRAFLQLLSMHRLQLLTPDELMQFSEQTRNGLSALES